MGYSLKTDMTWADTRQDIEETMRKWGVDDWNLIHHKNAPASSRVYYSQGQDERRVTLRYVLRGQEIRLPMDRQNRAVDNLRVLYLALEAMRMNEQRGISDVMQEAYLQLAGPTGPRKRDPWEVLGLRPDAPLEVVEASYKALAKSVHPDTGGTNEQMAELTEAYETVKRQLNG